MTLESFLGPSEDWTPVRLVSHHMRLLGVLSESEKTRLVLVDFDNEKGS